VTDEAVEKKLTPFDFIDSICSREKTDLMVDEASTKAYLPFMVARGLSYYHDTILLVAELNALGDVPKRQHYDFLLGAIKPGRRRSRWYKPEKDERAALLSEALGVTPRKAVAMCRPLTGEQVDRLLDYARRGRGEEAAR
jgi:hypothetical protein